MKYYSEGSLNYVKWIQMVGVLDAAFMVWIWSQQCLIPFAALVQQRSIPQRLHL